MTLAFIVASSLFVLLCLRDAEIMRLKQQKAADKAAAAAAGGSSGGSSK